MRSCSVALNKVDYSEFENQFIFISRKITYNVNKCCLCTKNIKKRPFGKRLGFSFVFTIFLCFQQRAGLCYKTCLLA